jgi:hypothetical protein
MQNYFRTILNAKYNQKYQPQVEINGKNRLIARSLRLPSEARIKRSSQFRLRLLPNLQSGSTPHPHQQHARNPPFHLGWEGARGMANDLFFSSSKKNAGCSARISAAVLLR